MVFVCYGPRELRCLVTVEYGGGMAFSRKEFLVSALAFASTAVMGSGCGGDDEGTAAAGGTGGAAGGGTGGTSGKAGTGGTSGNPGAGGSGGASGTGGAAGNAGTGGAAGNAGTGGVAGNAGTGGVAGNAGTGGSPGSGGGNQLCVGDAVDTEVSNQHDDEPHHVTISAADIAAATPQTYTLSGDHPHDISLTLADFMTLRAGGSVDVTSTFDGGGPHSHVVTLACD
jgi:hypothetical protein